jgi:hypothetical protein
MILYKNLGLFLVVVLMTMFFGFLHNQVSYTISSELFNLLFFPEFGFVSPIKNTAYFSAGILGIISTLQMGVLMGLIYFVVLWFSKSNWKTIWKALFIHFGITMVVSTVGIIFGYICVDKLEYLDLNYILAIQHPKLFSAALWMHNFSYFGGAIGCLISCGYLLYHREI